MKKIYIISGEASGDIHCSNMIKELNFINPNIEKQGWGGDMMQKEGVRITKHYKELAFMGFGEVAKNIFKILKNFKNIKQEILNFNPDIVLLIDYPGFNMEMLGWLKNNNFQVIYYIAPQLWAWNEKRYKKIKKYVDLLLVILPFEEKYFQSKKINTIYVGHPLFQTIKVNKVLIPKYISLLPGSRKQEIVKNIEVFYDVARKLENENFLLAAMNHIDEKIYIKNLPKNVHLVYNEIDYVLNNSKFAVVTSGTATLETALYKVPQVVCYKTSKINYVLAKMLLNIKYISLVNIILDKNVINELIQQNFNSEEIIFEYKKMQQKENLEKITKEYEELEKLLNQENASKKVAKLINERI